MNPPPSVLRILDANANRAREALRTVEDHARFALDDQRLCGELKTLRHALAAALSGVLDEAILHRDTAGDVGTSVKLSDELVRPTVADVVTAAGKRAGEALRVLEEYLKVSDPAAASAVEGIRYRFYDLEKAVAAASRPGRFAAVRLCVLITERICKKPWREVAGAAIDGGADCLQLREPDLDGGELLSRAKWLAALCRRRGVILIINDRPDIALLAGADGVHVGQGDLPAVEARKIVGRGGIVGVSTHLIEQARQAVLDGADYVGCGPVYPSATKPRAITPGLSYLREAARGVRIPTVAIAGITAANADEVASTGASALAVTAAVCGSGDPSAAARAVRAAFLRSVP